MSLFDRPIRPETYAAIRFGTGFPHRGATSPDGLLAALEGPDLARAALPHLPLETTLAAARAYARANRAYRDGDAAALEEREDRRRWLRDAGTDSFVIDLARAVTAGDGFRERLCRFWADHFTVRVDALQLRSAGGTYLDDAIRTHLAGRFADMLKAAVSHPVMLSYLDQAGSVGPGSRVGLRRGRGLNENLAREVLELHTLGVGAGYGQPDVSEFAELLTGLFFNLRDGFMFRPDMAEPGAETLLGQAYGGAEGTLADIHAALDDLARHPATAAHLARKLAVHFVADDPDPGLVARMTDAYRQTEGWLPAVYAAMLAHPAAWRGYGAKARTPFDYVAAALRALGVGADDLRELPVGRVRKFLLVPMGAMGQRYRRAPGPDGWPEAAAAWITPDRLAARIAWAIDAVPRLAGAPPDPRDFVARALGDAAGARLTWAAGAAETRRDGIALVLASAEFNRR